MSTSYAVTRVASTFACGSTVYATLPQATNADCVRRVVTENPTMLKGCET